MTQHLIMKAYKETVDCVMFLSRISQESCHHSCDLMIVIFEIHNGNGTLQQITLWWMLNSKLKGDTPAPVKPF